MAGIECEKLGGCVTQQLLTALEDIEFQGESADRHAKLGNPEALAENLFKKSGTIDTAQALANQTPCNNCPRKFLKLFRKAQKDPRIK